MPKIARKSPKTAQVDPVRKIRPVLLLLLQLSILSAIADPAAQEIIRDPHFQQGFTLLSPVMGKKIVYATIPGPAGANPQWDLAQWASRFPLQPGDAHALADGSIAYSNPGKTVVIGKPGTPEADLSLGVNAGTEYVTPRQKGDPWPHLLVEQPIQPFLPLAKIGAARLHLEARLKNFTAHPMANYSPQLHAAHLHVSFIIQNRNRKSPGYGKYYWLTLPVYDDRYRLPPEFGAKDAGSPKKPGTGMFIYSPAAKSFTTASLHDKTWVTLDLDLLPDLYQGLAKAWAAGFLPESKNPADYALTSLGLGWEVTGSFDVEIQLRNFSLQVVSK
jgi:hypothetical protein